MVVEVEERHDQYNVVHVGGGRSTEQEPPDSSFPLGGYVRAGYDNRNLFGHGWTLSTTGEYGTRVVRATSTFLDRRFLGTLFRFDISASYLQQATVRLGDIRSWGGSIGFAREMYPGVDASIHYNLRDTTHTETSCVPRRGPTRTSTPSPWARPWAAFRRLEWLRLDNRLVPTRGFKFEALTELAPQALSIPCGRSVRVDVSFIKVGGHSPSVVPLFTWLILRHGFRYDQGFPFGGAVAAPQGRAVLRRRRHHHPRLSSWTARGSTVDARRPAGRMRPLVVDYRPLGGNLRILENVDLQFPISPPWYGSVFFDNGMVADSLRRGRAAQFRHGIGVRPAHRLSPIGDVTFAWGWPLDPARATRASASSSSTSA